MSATRAPSPVAVRGAIARNPGKVLVSRPVLAAITVLLLGLSTHLLPGLDRFELFSPPPTDEEAPVGAAPPVLEIGEARIETETHARQDPGRSAPPPEARGPIAEKGASALPPIDAEKPPVPIEDPSGRALDGFYRALARTAAKEPGAITRVVHFGDSIVTSDFVSSTLRRKLQKAFGDAGHGFVLMANAWPAYNHLDVYRFASSGWLVSRIVGPLTPDGLYGLGGVSFRAPPGSRARFGSAKEGEYGRRVSRFVVIYLEEPGGGTFDVNLDGKLHQTVATDGPEKKVKYLTVTAPDGEHELEVVTKSGTTRAFGVILEREQPGVVLDAIGVQGARIRFLDKQDDAHWAEQLRSRNPNLLVYQFGANESGDGFAYPMDEYHRTMKAVLQQGRDALPEAGCLVLAAMDRAEKRGTTLTSMEVIPAIVKQQKRAAREVGCAFWNTYEAMGGPGSMAAWVGRGLGQADLMHPTGSGGDVIATWVFRALTSGYDAFLARQAKQ